MILTKPFTAFFETSKMATMAGSIVAAIAGTLWLRWVCRPAIGKGASLCSEN